jgi:nitrogen-specific signal transduction histidine kinase
VPELASGAGIARLFGALTEIPALERVAVAGAVHPAGAGCERAWLLVWDARLEQLLVTGPTSAPRRAVGLEEWIGSVALPRLELEPPAMLPALSPQGLGAVASRAWSQHAAVLGEESQGGLPWSGAGGVGAVALRRAGRPWALVVGTWEAPPRDESHTALEAIGALGGQAAGALDLVREAKRRVQQSAGLAQLARAVGTTHNLAEVLHQVARLAALGTEARGSAVWIAGPQGLRLEIAHGAAGRRERLGRALHPLAAKAVEEGRARVADRATEELLLAPEVAADLESVVVCPAGAYGRVLGAVACYDRAPAHRSEPPGFPPADVEYVQALADLAGLAFDQADRFAGARLAERQRREGAARQQRLERQAWLGELAGRMAQEARNPLASVSAFARRMERGLAEGDPNREYLEIILRESERLERLLAEQLDYAPAAEGGLRLEDLNVVVQEVLTAASDAVLRRRVRLVKKLSPDLPGLLLDHERIVRVVANILDSALEALGQGGRIRVESRRLGACVVLEVAHDAPRAPGDLLEQIFVPFASQRPGGPAVGLAVAQQIVQEHGGEIRVRSEGEWATVFSLSLPVQENQDRRLAIGDRRRTRDRRAPRAGR